MSDQTRQMIDGPEYSNGDPGGCVGSIVLTLAVLAVVASIVSVLGLAVAAPTASICFLLSLILFVVSVISGQIAELIAVTKQRPHAGQLPNPLPVVAQRGEPKQAVTPTAPPIKVRE